MSINFTLIIPTRNRQNYLSRGIEFYKNSQINIIIIDSSEKKISLDIPASNIKYIHLPGLHFVSKIQEVLAQVETTYCGMCADDDFIIPSSIEACVNFLDNNLSYSSVQGNYITYQKTAKGINILPLLHPYKWSLSDELPSTRISKLFDNYFHLFYAIHRTSSFKEIFFSFNNSIKNLNFFEIHIAFISLINGKHETLPIFYNAREIIIGSTGQVAGNWVTFLNNEPDTRKWFINLISEKISTIEKCSIEYAVEVCETAIQKYVNNKKKLPLSQKLINLVIPVSKQFLIKNIKIKLLYGGLNNYNKSVTEGKKGYPFIEADNIVELDRIKSIVLKYPV